jgi:hypothetical protein
MEKDWRKEIMPSWIKKRFKQEMKKRIEPKNLSPNPAAQEAKPALLILAPFLVIFIAILYASGNRLITQDQFLIFVGGGVIVWFAAIIVVWEQQTTSAVSLILFDREMGFTENLHPRCEFYCDKENIREIPAKDKETIAKGPKRGCIHEGTFTDDNTCPGKLS